MYIFLFLLLSLFSTYLQATPPTPPVLLQYIADDLAPEVSGFIRLPEQSNTGTFDLSWSLENTGKYFLVEQYLPANSQWLQIYSGTNSTLAIQEVISGSYKYRVRSCIEDICSDYLTSNYINISLEANSIELTSFHGDSAELTLHGLADNTSVYYQIYQLSPQDNTWNVGPWACVNITSNNTGISLTDFSYGTYKVVVSAELPEAACNLERFQAEYTVTSAIKESASWTFRVPELKPDQVSTQEDNAKVINVLANDLYIERDTVKLNISQPEHGSAKITAENNILYTPDRDFNGWDFLEYSATTINTNVELTAANVTIQVSSVEDMEPVALDDNISITPSSPYTNGVIYANVLNNDYHPENYPISLKSIDNHPSHGSSQIVGNSISYRPVAEYCGSDNITYSIQSSTGYFAVADINIEVICPSFIPRAQPDTFLIDKNDEIAIFDVILNDLELNEGHTVRLYRITSAPVQGQASIIDGKIAYQPDSNYCGTDTLFYDIKDNIGTIMEDRTLGRVDFEIACQPYPVAAPDQYSLNESNETTLFDVILNDIELNLGRTISLHQIITAPLHGTANITDNKIQYKPMNNYCGKDSLYYDLIDNNDKTSKDNAPGRVDFDISCTALDKVIIKTQLLGFPVSKEQ
ncbi:Ig-like domain-containing protein [Thalassomonas sp. RHCl1]|uniref:Ig-like domain-containing protein n=1 Tax=Thalassomonas sp. RHCl1 TaxID=2995320 RepID=UPI00248D0DAD|nr:Ig-like domain-containing protein [Thalassomonas sp. RHCl1]